MVEVITEHDSAARDRLSMAYGRVRTSDARVECGRATDCYSRGGKGVNDVWFDVLGTFADPDDDDDPGGPDRRWLQMQDLGYVSKQAVKDAIAAYEQTAKQSSKDALRGHVSAE